MLKGHPIFDVKLGDKEVVKESESWGLFVFISSVFYSNLSPFDLFKQFESFYIWWADFGLIFSKVLKLSTSLFNFLLL